MNEIERNIRIFKDKAKQKISKIEIDEEKMIIIGVNGAKHTFFEVVPLKEVNESK